MEEQTKRYGVIDMNTGSLITEFEEGSVSIRTKKQDEYYQMKLMQTELQKDYGPFVFLLYTMKEDLNFNIADASLTRLIYLSTFLGYKGYLITDNGISITKRICKDKLGLSENTFSLFWNEMINNNIFEYKEKRIFMDKNMFCKGKIKTDKNAIRLNCETVRYLYEHCQSISNHKKLSNLFKVIPWLNREWNIVCWNPDETERDRVKYMTLGDFAEKMGYDRSNAKRLAKDLSKVTFYKKGEYEKKRAFLYVVDKDFAPDQWIVVMNPLVLYSGQNYKNVRGFEF